MPPRRHASIRGKAVIEFLDELVPAFIAAQIRDIGARVDALAIVAVDHPLVSEAVEEIAARGKPVFTLLSDLTTPARAGYVGVDTRKAGRTAAWTISRLARKTWQDRHSARQSPLPQPGNGRDQLSQLHARECAPASSCWSPSSIWMTSASPMRLSTDMIASNADLVGIYMSGGGMAGLVRALRDEKAGRPHHRRLQRIDPDQHAPP